MKTVVFQSPAKERRSLQTGREKFIRPVKLLGGVVLLALLGACAHERNPGVVYYAPPKPPPPTVPPAEQPSEKPRPGSYRSPHLLPPVEVVPAPELSPNPAPVPGVITADASVATSISQLLQPYRERSGLWTRVEATVENGVVTLRGVVPSLHERYELVQRVSKLAGVSAVHDHLEASDLR